MKISDWLDEQVGTKEDVSQISLPTNMAYDEVPDETIFSKRLILAAFSVAKIILFLLLNALGTGITVEVKTKKPVFIQQK